ncbi:hypothetical protein DSM106044_00416 [Robinsoniella peoriensis]|uniref:Uncharacterized protein n=1 Tax=Robinsoniella peoriensis TaxID=180332 RepID=A0A4U8QCD3_9FIRM|nr:hypothetical protein DSM106044_00416 [Robinsoniella peoriensis]
MTNAIQTISTNFMEEMNDKTRRLWINTRIYY